MGSQAAIVPVIGGLVLIVGGFLALWADRRDLLAPDSTAPKPIMIRYTSQATYALKKTPHWIFLCTAILFAPLLAVTAVWQAELAMEMIDLLEKDGDDDEEYYDYEKLANDLRLFGFITAAALVLVAASPMGNTVGTILHTIFAGCTASLGINYIVRAQALAHERGMETLAMTRMILWMLALVGAAVMIFTVYFGVVATERLQKHEEAVAQVEKTSADDGLVVVVDPPQEHAVQVDDVNADDDNKKNESDDEQEKRNPILTLQQIKTYRMFETLLAICQISVAFFIGICLITAAAEVGDVQDISGTDSLLVGLVAAACAVTTGAVFYFSNDFFFGMCQAEKTTADDKEEEVNNIKTTEDETADKKTTVNEESA